VRRSSAPARIAAPATRPLGPEEQAVLTAAVEIYHRRLLDTPLALGYLEGRGLDRLTGCVFLAFGVRLVFAEAK
jgi:hypothetical protein